MATKEKETKKKKKRFNPFCIIHGRLFSLDFFAKHALKIILLMLMLIVYISNKYQCQTKIETIIKLENEVEIMKTESVREKSIYMGQSRESVVKAMSDSLGLNLDPSTQPPYQL